MPTPPIGVIDAAVSAADKWGVPASVTLAQWALESGWGAHMPPDSFNPFGIKALAGQPSVLAQTKECINGVWESVRAPFRRYTSYAEAFDDHARLLATHAAYAPAMAAKDNPVAFARALQGTYATDPNYGAELTKIMQTSNLYQYDKQTPLSVQQTTV